VIDHLHYKKLFNCDLKVETEKKITESIMVSYLMEVQVSEG